MKNKNELGIIHYLPIFIIFVVLAAAVGYSAYRTYQAENTSYSGIFVKNNCSSNSSSCTTYGLKIAGKTYNLAITTQPKVAPGAQVTVTGKTLSASSSQPTISVSSIVPAQPAASSSSVVPSAPNHLAVEGFIDGTVTITTAPGTMPAGGQPTSPSPAPYQASILVENSTGTTIIETVESNSNGNFTTAVAPGTYKLVPQGGSKYVMAPSAQTVTITAGASTKVTFNYSGLAA